MRSVTFEIILDQLKHKRDQELAILIEQQKQETLQSKLIVKNQEIDELKRTQAGFQKNTTNCIGDGLMVYIFENLAQEIGSL